MEHSFPCPIKNDKDLGMYEDYINKCESDENKPIYKGNSGGYQMFIENKAETMARKLSDTVFMPGFLKTMIGKIVRVESLIGNCLETRVGTLINVGADYIVLKLYQSCSTMICESSTIKYITVIHDNDINKIGLF